MHQVTDQHRHTTLGVSELLVPVWYWTLTIKMTVDTYSIMLSAPYSLSERSIILNHVISMYPWLATSLQLYIRLAELFRKVLTCLRGISRDSDPVVHRGRLIMVYSFFYCSTWGIGNEIMCYATSMSTTAKINFSISELRHLLVEMIKTCTKWNQVQNHERPATSHVNRNAGNTTGHENGKEVYEQELLKSFWNWVYEVHKHPRSDPHDHLFLFLFKAVITVVIQ